MATTKAKRSVHKKQSARNKPAPGQLGLLERRFQGRRFVEFPQVKGKTAERVQLYTASDYHSITIEFQDRTSLNLAIEPGFTIDAELQQRRKAKLHTVAEWPPIRSQS